MAAQRVLEIGTSNGYSTIWLGDAAEAVARHRALAGDRRRADRRGARQPRAGGRGRGSSSCARRTPARRCRRSPSGAFDLVFLDAERQHYVGYWPDLLRVLRDGGLLVVDNCLSHAKELVDFSELVYSAEGVTSTLVTVGAGVLLIVKSPELELLWRDASQPLERGRERERAAVADLRRDAADGRARFEQQVGGERDPPAREEAHRRLAHEVVEAAGERGAGDAGAAGERLDRPRVGGVVVQGLDRGADDRIGLRAVPAGRVGGREVGAQRGDQQQVEQAVEHRLLARLVLDDLVGQQLHER